MKITNNSGMSLPMAVWALHDEYDYQPEENYISATSLMRPLRQLILGNRVPMELRTADVSDYIARTLGHAIHDSIEKAWTNGYARSLRMLGYPQDVIERIRINPTDDDLIALPDIIPVYLEQREKRKLGKYLIGGKYDMVAEGIVQDYKSTSAFVWLKGSRDDEHALQGSIYRWLNPKKITEDFIRINYIFTDWQKSSTSNPAYPQNRVMSKDVPLLSMDQTEQWMSNKLDLYEKFKDAPEKEIPECTDEELWRSAPQYKYYSDPTKTDGRSSKNFDDAASARVHVVEKGGKGIIKTVPGEPKRCGHCNAFDACTQKDRYGL